MPIEWTAEPGPLVSLSLTRPRDAARVLRLLRRWEAAVAGEHERRPFDVVLALWAVPAGWVARRIRHRYGVPYAVWTLGTDINVYGARAGTRRIIGAVLRDADAIFANSHVLARRVGEIAGRQAEFLATSRPIERPAQRPALPEAVNFLFIGRLEEVKGADVLIEAAAGLAARTGGWHLTIIGDGSDADSLHERVQREPVLSGRVTFTGHLDGERLLSYLFACDCVVIPSRSESMPVVFSEALQARKPLIVTDVGDLGGIVGRYHLGQVVRPDDAEGLGRALESFVAAPPADVTPSQEVLRLYDIGRSAGRFSEIAGEVIGRRRSGEE